MLYKILKISIEPDDCLNEFTIDLVLSTSREFIFRKGILWIRFSLLFVFVFTNRLSIKSCISEKKCVNGVDGMCVKSL